MDISEPSIAVARGLLESVGLQSFVSFVAAPIEQFAAETAGLSPPLPGSGSGSGSQQFDLITCTGVLHHLADPAAALGLLRGILAPAGGILLSVYGRHGRHGLYELQEALRLALPAGELLSDSERLAEARQLLFGSLTNDEQPGGAGRWIPDTAAVHGNSAFAPAQQQQLSDSELFDRLLHSRDVAFTVPELHGLVGSVPGLRLLSTFPDAAYEPDYVVFRTAAARNSSMARPATAATTVTSCFPFSVATSTN